MEATMFAFIIMTIGSLQIRRTLGDDVGAPPYNDIIIYHQSSIIAGDTVKVIEGKDLQLTCVYMPNGKMTTVWEIQEKGIKTVNPYRLPKIQRKANGSELDCVLRDVPQIKRQITLEVLYPPNQPVINRPLLALNNPSNLTCHADSYPPSSYIWQYAPYYYTPIVSKGPVFTINHGENEKKVYCIARNVMEPTDGMPVKTVASAEYEITLDRNKTQSVEQEGYSNLENNAENSNNNGNESTGLIVAALLGWISAVIVGSAAIIMYLRIRTLSIRCKGMTESGNSNIVSSHGSKTSKCMASNDLNLPERISLENKSSNGGSNDGRPKVPERPPHTLSSDKIPLHSYIELQSTEDSVNQSEAWPISEDIYEHIKDGMPEQRKKYEELNKADADVQVDGYLEPTGSQDYKAADSNSP